MGHCSYPGCDHTKQGCFRQNCRFMPTAEYTTHDAFNDMEKALNDAAYVYSGESIALDAINYIKQKFEQIQNFD